MRFAYLITTWNGARIVETIHSLARETRVLVVDTSQHAWPLAKGWNYGIDRLLNREGFDAVIVTQDDVVLRDDTGISLAEALLEGQYQPGVRPGPEALMVTARHANHGDMFTDEVNWELLKAKQPEWQPGPDFSCFCVGRKLFDVVGQFDEGFVPCYHEDNDMHRRIQLAGYEAYAYAPYWHYRSATIRTDPERKAVLEGGGFQDSLNHYLNKWGGPPHHEVYTVPYNGRRAA